MDQFSGVRSGGRGVIRHPDGSVTVTYKLEITRGRKGQRRVAEPAPPQERPAIDPATVLGITRMLVLGHHFERLVREGKVKNYAEIARLTGLSRARVTQIANLAHLPVQLQNALILEDGRLPAERILRTAGSGLQDHPFSGV
jgi:hypothetical protein